MQVDAKQRYLMITEAAYFLAEKRGFAPGHEHEDWLTAERQVDEMLSALEQNPALEQRLETGEKPKRGRKTAATGTQPAAPARRTRKTAVAAPAASATTGAMASAETAIPARTKRTRKAATAEKPAGTRSRAKSSTNP